MISTNVARSPRSPNSHGQPFAVRLAQVSPHPRVHRREQLGFAAPQVDPHARGGTHLERRATEAAPLERDRDVVAVDRRLELQVREPERAGFATELGEQGVESLDISGPDDGASWHVGHADDLAELSPQQLAAADDLILAIHDDARGAPPRGRLDARPGAALHMMGPRDRGQGAIPLEVDLGAVAYELQCGSRHGSSA